MAADNSSSTSNDKKKDRERGPGAPAGDGRSASTAGGPASAAGGPAGDGRSASAARSASTPTDRVAEIDQLFLDQYRTPEAPADTPATLAPPEQILVSASTLVTAILLGMLPALSPEVRALMTGQLTTGVRELILTVIQLLTDHPDIAAEAGFGPDVFDHIARSDVELENLGGAWNDLVLSLTLAEGQQRGALFAMNAQALLAVHDMLDELGTPEQRGAHDVLQAKFRSAFSKQAEIAALRAQGATPAGQPTKKELAAQLAQATQDSDVRHAIAAIQATARSLGKSGTPPLLPPVGKGQ